MAEVTREELDVSDLRTRIPTIRREIAYGREFQVLRDGVLYRTGCAGGTGSGSAMAVLAMMSLMAALVHGVFTWAAVSQD